MGIATARPRLGAVVATMRALGCATFNTGYDAGRPYLTLLGYHPWPDRITLAQATVV